MLAVFELGRPVLDRDIQAWPPAADRPSPDHDVGIGDARGPEELELRKPNAAPDSDGAVDVIAVTGGTCA